MYANHIELLKLRRKLTLLTDRLFAQGTSIEIGGEEVESPA
jgi:hypothetical protein